MRSVHLTATIAPRLHGGSCILFSTTPRTQPTARNLGEPYTGRCNNRKNRGSLTFVFYGPRAQTIFRRWPPTWLLQGKSCTLRSSATLLSATHPGTQSHTSTDSWTQVVVLSHPFYSERLNLPSKCEVSRMSLKRGLIGNTCFKD